MKSLKYWFPAIALSAVIVAAVASAPQAAIAAQNCLQYVRSDGANAIYVVTKANCCVEVVLFDANNEVTGKIRNYYKVGDELKIAHVGQGYNYC